jgi:DNA-3-methyladenine glycosylase I
MTEIIRCDWCAKDPLYISYHDEEWGVPEHDDRKLLEKIILDGAQAGLSWITILRKREGYRKAFDSFDPEKIARYNQRKIDSLMNNPGIVRNKLKVEAAKKNAIAYLALKDAGKTFDETLWQFTNGRTKQNDWKSLKQVPAQTPESVAMSKELLRLGFKFVGPTICYAFMQAIGMVNDHLVTCHRYDQV